MPNRNAPTRITKSGRIAHVKGGFKNVAARIAHKEGISKERASAILAASTRRASPAAKRANPNLKRVKG